MREGRRRYTLSAVIKKGGRYNIIHSGKRIIENKVLNQKTINRRRE